MLAVVAGASAIGCGGQPPGSFPSSALENEPPEWSFGMVQFGATLLEEDIDWGDQVEDE
jgi:hypothetical protein